MQLLKPLPQLCQLQTHIWDGGRTHHSDTCKAGSLLRCSGSNENAPTHQSKASQATSCPWPDDLPKLWSAAPQASASALPATSHTHIRTQCRWQESTTVVNAKQVQLQCCSFSGNTKSPPAHQSKSSQATSHPENCLEPSLNIVALAITMGNNILHYVSAVKTVVITVL